MREIKSSYFNLYTTVRDLVRNFLFIVLAALIGFFGCRIYCENFKEDNFTTTMMVSINLSGYTEISTATSLARTVIIADVLSNVFQSDVLRSVVEEKTGKAFDSEMKSKRLGETNLVKISVTNTDPKKAYETLCAVEESYSTVTDLVFNNVVIMTVESPGVPTSVDSKRADLINQIKYGIAAGLVVAVFFVLFSYFRDTIKNESDIKDMLDARLLGTIYNEKGIKRKDYKDKEKGQKLMITARNTTYSFTERFKKMAIKLESLKRTKNINSILITSVFENEGKTTVSVNLALSLAQEGNKVLIIDADLKKPNLRHYFKNIEVTADGDFGAFLKGKGSVTDFIVKDTNSNLDILCCAKSCRGSAELLGSERFKNGIKQLEEIYDFVIIDTSPSGLTADAEIAVETVSAAILVVRQDYTDVSAINDYLENLDSSYVIGCILNNVYEFGSKKRSNELL